MNKLRVLELFGGIGACSKALERLGIDYEIADYVEIDKYAVKSFNAMHNTNFQPQDICEWDKNIKVDLIMHGSPCQDFSIAGKQAGGNKDSGTRSSLMYETLRIVEKLKPKYVIWENVKNLLSKNHRHNFDSYLETMEHLGYTNFYQVLNAKDYGIPQNRERVFTISILGNEKYNFPIEKKCENKINRKYGLYNQTTRWGVYDKNGIAPTITASMGMGGGHVPMVEIFNFPKKQELKLKLKDILEDEVDEKYYLSEKMMNYVLDNNETQKSTKWEGRADNDTLNSNIAHTLSVRGAGGSQRAGVSNFIVDDYDGEIKVKELKLKIKSGTKKWEEKIIERIPLKFLNRNQKNINGEYAFCVDSCNTGGIKETQGGEFRIRKLTPKECWRLMGFDDEDFEKAEKVNSNTQLYKQAGNSIVVNVLMAIFNELLKKKEE